MPATIHAGEMIPVPARLLPPLLRGAVYLVYGKSQELHEIADELIDDPARWGAFDDARTELARRFGALDELRQARDSDDDELRVSVAALTVVADEAARSATLKLDDFVEMQQRIDTVEGLDDIAAQVAAARELRELADKVGAAS